MQDGPSGNPISRAPHVVIIGAGFGGLEAAKQLTKNGVEITMVDRNNYHLFQPLLYQVAMAGLSPADIAQPVRSILHEHARVRMAEVTSIDVAKREIRLGDEAMPYDYLVVAAGAENGYFGHPEWQTFAPGLKSIEDAVDIRRRVLLAFERAEWHADEAERKKLLTFIVIGGGPTGVELAGSVGELSTFVLASDFRSIHPREARVILIEAGPRVLASFPPELSQRAAEQLQELGVEIVVGKRVESIDADGIVVGGERIAAATVLWAAGVRPSPLGQLLGAPLVSGRVRVLPDLSIPDHPEVFVIGDMSYFEQDGEPLPGVSPVAMQQARRVASNILADVRGLARTSFRYTDKGSMATIGRSRAVAHAGRFELTGMLAWLAWLVVHIWYLIGFRNRLAVMLTWFWSYATYKRGARLITETSLTSASAPPPMVATRAPAASAPPSH